MPVPGAVRFGGEHFLFEPETGPTWNLHVPNGYWKNPRDLDQLVLFEGLHVRKGWLLLHRLIPLGYDVPPPVLLGFRMMLGIN